MKHYLAISEFEDINCFSGEIRPELIDAVKKGVYSLIDMTDPERPLELTADMKWIPVVQLPAWD